MWNNQKQQKIVSLMSNLQTYYHFKLDFQKVDQHTGGKWLIQGTKRRKDNHPGENSPVIPVEEMFYSRWPPSPLIACCYTIKTCKFINICHRKTILVCTTMFLKYRKHNGIIIPTLFLTLQVKIQYVCRYKANIINDIGMWGNKSISRSGFPCNPLQLYSIIAF